MPRAAPIQTNFTGGEWSPSMYGRVDLPKYYNACRQMRNFYAKTQGPAVRRGGTKYVASIVTPSAAGRLIPFEFSVTQAYILLFENNTFRVFKDNGIVAGPVDVTTTYATADLPTLKYAQSADTLYITHPSYPPRKVTRSSDTSWTITTISFQDGPYLPVNTTTTTLTPSGGSYAKGDTPTVTASAVTGINDGDGFQTTDVGRLLRIKNGSNWAWGTIASRSSTTVVTVTVESDQAFPSSATADWRLGTWSATTGYPATVTFFQDRLCFGGEPSQRLDLSKTGDYETFSPTATDGTVAGDDAIAITLNANDVNVIRWLADDEKGLIVGTVGGEWIVRASSQGEALSPDNAKATRSTTFGSANIQPVRVDNATLFVQRAGLKLMEHAYVFEADGFRSPEMTLFAEEITSGGLTQLAFQQEPDRLLWAVRSDGRLCCMTYERDQEVIGWSLHTIGGQSDANGTIAKVESIAVIPSADGTRDELWMIVQRYINGGTVRYVEYMTAPLPDTGDQEDAIYVDSALTYDSTATTSVTGAGHLEGETATILADGASHPTKTIASGGVTLEVSSSVVQLGLPFTSTIETMNLEAGAADGTAQGRIKRFDHVTFRLHRTLGGMVGPDTNTLDSIPDSTFRSSGTAMGSPPALFSGDAEVVWPGGYEREGRIIYQKSDAFPAQVQAIMPKVVTNQR